MPASINPEVPLGILRNLRKKLPAIVAFWVRFIIVALPTIYVLVMIIPMLAGETSDGTDEFDAMMKMYE